MVLTNCLQVALQSKPQIVQFADLSKYLRLFLLIQQISLIWKKASADNICKRNSGDLRCCC